MAELEGYTLQFESEFDNNVKELLPLMQKYSQGEKAKMFGVSRRTIVSFEKADGSCRNYWLLFCYRMKVYGDAII